MATFYIIDGPDGAGKTTLVKKIIEANPGAITMHFSKPNSDEEAFNYWKVYLEALKKSAGASVVIFDRSWYSDMVYGPVMRGREEMTKENMETLELAVRALGGGLILYCTGKPEVLWRRCKQRGEVYIDRFEQLKALHDKYEEVMRLPKYLPVVRYDTTVRW